MRRAFFSVLAAFGLVLAMPLVAHAAPASAEASAPLAVPSLEVQVWPAGEPGETVVIISASVPVSVKLPVTIRIPVPTGTIVWSGEILGGDPNRDPSRQARLVEANGGRYAQFELSQARVAQVEMRGFPLAIDGDKVTSKVAWLQTSEASETAFSVRIPADVSKVSIDPKPTAKPQENETGESLYSLPSKKMKPGGTQNITVSYSTVPPSEGGLASVDYRTALIVLGVVLLVFVGALVAVMGRQRRET